MDFDGKLAVSVHSLGEFVGLPFDVGLDGLVLASRFDDILLVGLFPKSVLPSILFIANEVDVLFLWRFVLLTDDLLFAL